MKLREIRAALTDYFGNVERTVTIERYGGKKYVTVRYVDFLPRPVVEDGLSRMLSKECVVYAMRLLSERKKKETDLWLAENIGTARFFSIFYQLFP